MNALQLIFLIICCSLSLALSAQDTLSRSAWIERVYTLVYADADLSADETQWVKQILDKNCDCKAIEAVVESEECYGELIKYVGLPTKEAELDAITPEQMRKLNLLAPMMSMIGGKCPDK